MILGGNGIEERFSALPRLLRDAIILETWEGPHGLLLSRQLMDIQKFCAGMDPKTIVQSLQGDVTQDYDALAANLSSILQNEDPRQAAIDYSQWADDLYQAFGANAWKKVSVKPA